MFGQSWSTMGTGGVVAMVLLWVAILAAAIWGIDKLLPWSRSDASEKRFGGDGTARDILDRRLAAGEIDIETHHRLLATLAVGPQP